MDNSAEVTIGFLQKEVKKLYTENIRLEELLVEKSLEKSKIAKVYLREEVGYRNLYIASVDSSPDGLVIRVNR